MNNSNWDKTKEAGMDCPKCGEELEVSIYKDILEFHGWYFTVEITACPECGHVDQEQSYME